MKTTMYEPPAELLDRYAQVLVAFALGAEEGIREHEVVQCLVPDVAKPFAKSLQKAILQAGGHPVLQLLPTGLDADFFTYASDQQLEFFPRSFFRARAKLFDHSIGILADTNPFELSEIDPAKILKSRNAKKPYRDWLNHKESAGKYTWTLALYGTEAKAQLAGLSIDEYWQQIIQACFLDQPDPIAAWRRVNQLQATIRQWLNQLSIRSLQIEGPDTNIKITLGEQRKWQGGINRNIPSFELFTSPDWRGCEGWIRFNQPVYRYGNMIKDVELEVKQGRVTRASASEGENLLLQMLKTPNADKFGEVSLTDKRLSHITKFMAETLYDENIGGPEGNTHLAIGMAYRDCFAGDQTKMKKSDWNALGYNDSSEHTDFVSTTSRRVTAQLSNGQSKVIYQNGQFTLK